MAKKDEKDLSSYFDDSEPELDAETAITSRTGRAMRRISPLGMRVVVRIRAEANMSEAGLYLPEGAKSAMAESVMAEVLEVASATDKHTKEETNISGVPEGAIVLIKKTAGVKVPWDDNLRIVETSEVLAVVHEFELT